MSDKNLEKECPYCQETIKANAAKCKHCCAMIGPVVTHGGTCPYCKEEVHEDALRCKHCKSDIAINSNCNCGSDVQYSESSLAMNSIISGSPVMPGAAMGFNWSPYVHCWWEPYVCGSSLPGYPPIICYREKCVYVPPRMPPA
jgi:hypothetical protein